MMDASPPIKKLGKMAASMGIVGESLDACIDVALVALTSSIREDGLSLRRTGDISFRSGPSEAEEDIQECHQVREEVEGSDEGKNLLY